MALGEFVEDANHDISQSVDVVRALSTKADTPRAARENFSHR
jgi:hypothetical protein